MRKDTDKNRGMLIYVHITCLVFYLTLAILFFISGWSYMTFGEENHPNEYKIGSLFHILGATRIIEVGLHAAMIHATVKYRYHCDPTCTSDI